jgi:hypothetical protein
MEDFLLLVLAAAFVWLAIRLSNVTARLKQLEDQLDRLPAHPPAASQAPLQMPPPPAVSRAVEPAPPRPIEVVRPAPPQPVPAPVAATEIHRPAYIPPPPAATPLRAPTGSTSTPPPGAPFMAQPHRDRSGPPASSEPTKPHVSLEARLGQNWLNKLGITALVIGLALGLGKLLVNIGPAGKDAIGFVLALGILGLGIYLERKPAYKLFARVLIGGGWALTFFLSYAIYNVTLLQVLHSETLDLILMFAVAAAMVTHSLRYHSQVVTTFAFLLAFVTVGLSNVTLFSLVAGALLTAALALIVYRERWYALGLAGLIGVYLNHFLWLHRVLPDGGISYLQRHGQPFPEFVPSALLLLAYWLIFRLIYVLRPPVEDSTHDVNQTLATAAALIDSAGLLGLMKYQSSHPEWAFYGLLALGLAELALSLIARSFPIATKDDIVILSATKDLLSSTPPSASAATNRTAFITLSTLASVLLLAAIPFRFHGASWILFWLLEAEAFYLTGIRLPEVVFRRIGVAANLLASAVVIAISAGVLASTGATASPGHRVVVLFAAALIIWFNAEFSTRRWPTSAQRKGDRTMLRITSYLAPVLAALGLTFLLHPDSVWLGIAWLLLALALGFIADRIASTDLATQADLLALAAIFRTCCTNLFLNTEHTHGIPARLITVGITAALLYLAMRRKTASYLLTAAAIAPAYAWIAGALVALLCWYQLEPISVAVAWGVFGLILFELGILFRKDYLRHQSYALLAAAFIRIFFANMQVPGTNGDLSPSLYTVLPLIAAFAYVYERTHSLPTTQTLSSRPETYHNSLSSRPETEGRSGETPVFGTSDDLSSRPKRNASEIPAFPTRLDTIAGSLFSWCALIAAGTLIYFEVRPGWIMLAWTLLSISLLALAWALKRTIFIAQSLLVLIFATARGIAYHLFYPTPLAATFTTSHVFTISLASALMLLSLPMAFYLRRYFTTGDRHPDPERSRRAKDLRFADTQEDESSRPERSAVERPAFGTTSTLDLILHHPEQPYFFAPLLLLTLLLYVQLDGGRITIGWVALGVVTFLFALAVKERSYRLSGLSLLMLGVAKVLLWDVWHVPPTDRYLTLIIMGAALLLVSFLYSRYRETLLKLL